MEALSPVCDQVEVDTIFDALLVICKVNGYPCPVVSGGICINGHNDRVSQTFSASQISSLLHLNEAFAKPHDVELPIIG